MKKSDEEVSVKYDENLHVYMHYTWRGKLLGVGLSIDQKSISDKKVPDLLEVLTNLTLRTLHKKRVIPKPKLLQSVSSKMDDNDYKDFKV